MNKEEGLNEAKHKSCWGGKLKKENATVHQHWGAKKDAASIRLQDDAKKPQRYEQGHQEGA